MVKIHEVLKVEIIWAAIAVLFVLGISGVISEERETKRNGSENKLVTSSGHNKMYLCLNNCALCVRQWETGLYSGEKCAKRCLKFRANPRVVDPDCNQIKLFNHKLIKSKLRRHSLTTTSNT